MADFLDEKRNEIAVRLKELKPLVEEYHRLEAATAALEAVSLTRQLAATRASRSRGRPKGSGMRRSEALEIVKANPGITVAQIAEKMGIRQNYLYRVLAALADDHLVRKEGRAWYPAQDA